jgi:hypothetical protein
MAVFSIGKPITTAVPVIAVDPGLAIGVHRFQLEVIDTAGNRSKPDVAEVTVQRLVITLPTPALDPVILDPTRPTPGPIISTPTILTPTSVSPVLTPAVLTPTASTPVVSPTSLTPAVTPLPATPKVSKPTSPAPAPKTERSKPK